MKLPIPYNSDRSAHFIGAGGAGMSALASILLGRGVRVSGSDLRYGPAAKALAGQGATIFVGHDAGNLAEAGMVVVSSAIRPDNPELLEARRLGLPIWHRAKLLSAIMNASEQSLAVSGTHGKSTTSAMAALCLHHAGLKPTAALGAALDSLGGNALAGDGRIAVAEVDESDGSFLAIRPTMAVVTNLDSDHMDTFGTDRGLREAFRLFLEGVDPEGGAVVCADCSGARELLKSYNRPVTTYGIFPRQADVRARSVRLSAEGSTFRVDWRGRDLGEIYLAAPGLHNVRNALAVVAALRLMEVDFEDIAAGLAEYRGVSRRFELVGESEGVRVVDDYAHHPAEIEATLQAARTLGARRVVAVFQPHRYSRTQALADQFGGAFHSADEVVVTDVYAAGEDALEGVDGRMVRDCLRRQGHNGARFASTLQDAAERLRAEVREGDLVLTMGAGDVRRAGSTLLEFLEEDAILRDGARKAAQEVAGL